MMRAWGLDAVHRASAQCEKNNYKATDAYSKWHNFPAHPACTRDIRGHVEYMMESIWRPRELSQDHLGYISVPLGSSSWRLHSIFIHPEKAGAVGASSSRGSGARTVPFFSPLLGEALV